MAVSGQLLIQKQANGSFIYYHEEDNEYNSKKQDKENDNLKYNEYIDLSVPKKNSSVLKNDADLDTKTQQNSNEKSNTTKQDEIVSNKETNKNNNDNKDNKDSKDKDNKDDKDKDNKGNKDDKDKDNKNNDNEDNKNKETDLSKVDAKVEEPIKVFDCEVKSPLEWLLTDDKVITPFGAEKISNDYIELVSYIFSTFVGSGLGLFLISTGVFSGLGMAILLYANTPTPVIEHLCEKVDSATGGFIPLKKYTSITKYTIEYIKNAPERISDKVKKKEEELKMEREFQKRKQKITAQTKLSLLKQQTKNTNEKTDIPKENGKMANTIINNRNNKNISNVMTI